jgi:L,D-transpeptidase ErfK/SrfK
MMKKYLASVVVVMMLTVAMTFAMAAHAPLAAAHTWSDADFVRRPLSAYPMPSGRNDIIGSLSTYTIQKGDTLLDVGRWFGVTAKEISDANGHIDWWLPPAGRVVILPTAHILPAGPHSGIVLNVPEMRLYYYYPPPARLRRRKHTKHAPALNAARVVYTFPVGLGRFDWKTPLGAWHITAKVKNPAWVLPQDIYQEHLERDGEAQHVVPPGPDNPLGQFKLTLSIPEYGIHGTNVPWGVGMTVSHGCVRLYPEDIDRLFHHVQVGTPGKFVYEPIKFGWRGDALYVEVHDDLYGRYPGLWRLAMQVIRQQHLTGKVDLTALEKAVASKAGIPTYVGLGPIPSDGIIPEIAAIVPPYALSDATASSAPPSVSSDTSAPSSAAAPDSTASADYADSPVSRVNAGRASGGAPARPGSSGTVSFSEETIGSARALPMPPMKTIPAATSGNSARDGGDNAPDGNTHGEWSTVGPDSY